MERSSLEQHKDQEGKLSRRCIYEGRVISCVVDEIAHLDGKEKSYELIKHPGAVAVIPIAANGDLILIKQWRYAAQQVMIELPAGLLESGEPPIECAQRELREEIGMRAKVMTSIGGFFTAPGFCNEYIHLFVAKELTCDPLVAEDTDSIDQMSMPLEKILKIIETGGILNSITMTALFRYKQWAGL